MTKLIQYFLISIFTITPAISIAGIAASFWQLENPTILMEAASSGNLSKVKQLLKTGRGSVNEANSAGSTPLIYAASNGNLNVARYLLKKGADPNKCARDNMCPLWYTVKYGSYDLTALLIKSGANPKVNPEINALVHPALKSAAGRGNLDIVKLLVDNGAEVDYQGPPWNSTALAMAVRLGKVNTSKYLLEKGASIREVTEKIYYDGETAMEIALREDRKPIVEFIEIYLKQISYKPKYSFDALIERLFSDPNFDMTKEGGELNSILKQQTKENLRKIHNTIFAKKNYNFDDSDLTEFYKNRFPSYKPTSKKIQLNKIDKRNVEYIRELEEYAKWRDAAG